MKNKERSYLIVLASIAFLLLLIVFSSTALAVNNGYTLASQGNYEEAIKAFDEAIEIDSQDSDAWYNKGVCLEHLGNYEEAIKAFDRSIEINPQDFGAWNNKGICLVHLGDYEEAIKAYDKAIEIDSQRPEAWYNKGLLLEGLCNYEEAIKAFDKVIRIYSQDSDPWYNKGYCFECLGNYEEAIKAFDKTIEIDSQDSYAWYNKGVCLAHLGDYEEAVKALDKAIEIDPQNLEALSLKETILSNSNESTMLSKVFFSNNNIFVEEDDLLEYAQTYLQTYENILNKSELTNNDLVRFSFYKGYPYSVAANISNIHGASIKFIPHSINENKVTRISYPIEGMINKVNKEDVNKSGMVISIDNFSNFSLDLDIIGGFVYVNGTNGSRLYTDNSSIILAEGVRFNGVTYIKSAKLLREGDLIINGTLVLDDSKLIIKSNLKKDWTKERAEENAIDLIFKEQIDGIYDYSKFTGIGFYEIEKLVADYKEKEMKGYYEVNKIDKWNDRQAIFDKADQYGIPHESVTIELLENKQETKFEKLYRNIEVFLTTYSFIILIVGGFAWVKRKNIYLRMKKIFRD